MKAIDKELAKILKREGSPEHEHLVPGRWDGDAKHRANSECCECAAYDKLRRLALAQLDNIEASKQVQLL